MSGHAIFVPVWVVPQANVAPFSVLTFMAAFSNSCARTCNSSAFACLCACRVSESGACVRACVSLVCARTEELAIDLSTTWAESLRQVLL